MQSPPPGHFGGAVGHAGDVADIEAMYLIEKLRNRAVEKLKGRIIVGDGEGGLTVIVGREFGMAADANAEVDESEGFILLGKIGGE